MALENPTFESRPTFERGSDIYKVTAYIQGDQTLVVASGQGLVTPMLYHSEEGNRPFGPTPERLAFAHQLADLHGVKVDLVELPQPSEH